MVAQIFEDIPNDLCLVFLGQKFIGKTFFFKNLLPPELHQLFTVQSFKNDKDFRRDAGRYMLILDDEFKYLRVATNELIKSLLSMTTVTVRVPYARKPVAYKRVASYCISSNERFILKDPTGNRRLICFWVDSIDKDKFNSIDKVDLLMEAYHLYNSKFDHILTRDLLSAIEGVSSEFEETTNAQEILKQYLPPAMLSDNHAFWWPVNRIVKEVADIAGVGLSYYEVGNALRKLEYHHKFLDVNGSKLCCWLVKESEYNESNFNHTPNYVLDFFFEKSKNSKKKLPPTNDLPPLSDLLGSVE